MKVKYIGKIPELPFTFGKEYDIDENLKNSDGHYEVVDDDGDLSYLKPDEFEVLKEEPVEWSGEGYPSIGTVCEYQSSDGTWKGPARVFAHHELGGVFVEYLDHVGWDNSPDVERFRPFKSEKDKEIKKIMKITAEAQPIGEDIAKRHAHALYNAGLRFTKESK